MDSVQLQKFGRPINEYRNWLSTIGDNGERLERWNHQLAAPANQEGAIVEAYVWQFLSEEGLRVESAETSGSGPDFRCWCDAESFFVEATSIAIASAEKCFGPPTANGVRTWRPLTTEIWRVCFRKWHQLEQVTGPLLLAVGTLNSEAAASSFDDHGAREVLMGGNLKSSWTVDKQTGMMSTVQMVASLDKAAFLAPSAVEPYIKHRNTPISGVLLHTCGLPTDITFAALHPAPRYRFNPMWLPNVRFCRLKDGYESGPPQVECIGGTPSPIGS